MPVGRTHDVLASLGRPELAAFLLARPALLETFDLSVPPAVDERTGKPAR